MKESEIWGIVYDGLNIKYKNLWELPLSRLDVLMEAEFYQIRTRLINEEEIQTEGV